MRRSLRDDQNRRPSNLLFLRFCVLCVLALCIQYKHRQPPAHVSSALCSVKRERKVQTGTATLEVNAFFLLGFFLGAAEVGLSIGSSGVLVLRAVSSASLLCVFSGLAAAAAVEAGAAAAVGDLGVGAALEPVGTGAPGGRGGVWGRDTGADGPAFFSTTPPKPPGATSALPPAGTGDLGVAAAAVWHK